MKNKIKSTTHLYADGGGWGLPSIDGDALTAHALFRFCDLEYATSPADSRSLAVDQSSPVAIFPEDSTDSVMASGLQNIISVLCSENDLPDPNAKLTPFMSAESTVIHYTPFMRRRAVRAALKFAESDALMSDARDVLKALSDRLGERNKYFYGDYPSLLDALVFGQLAVPSQSRHVC